MTNQDCFSSQKISNKTAKHFITALTTIYSSFRTVHLFSLSLLHRLKHFALDEKIKHEAKKEVFLTVEI
jgi:hypothetical protein